MKITVSKEELLVKLHENRARHREVFEDALDGYHKAVTAWAAEQVERARRHKRPEWFPDHAPRDHAADYDRTIGMLSMHTGDEFTLDEREYASYVDDNWTWTGEWRASSKKFSASAYDRNYKDDEDEDDDE